MKTIIFMLVSLCLCLAAPMYGPVRPVLNHHGTLMRLEGTNPHTAYPPTTYPLQNVAGATTYRMIPVTSTNPPPAIPWLYFCIMNPRSCHTQTLTYSQYPNSQPLTPSYWQYPNSQPQTPTHNYPNIYSVVPTVAVQPPMIVFAVGIPVQNTNATNGTDPNPSRGDHR